MDWEDGYSFNLKFTAGMMKLLLARKCTYCNKHHIPILKLFGMLHTNWADIPAWADTWETCLAYCGQCNLGELIVMLEQEGDVVGGYHDLTISWGEGLEMPCQIAPCLVMPYPVLCHYS